MSELQCKKGWPRCPSCKTKLSLLTAGAAPLEGEEVGKSISAYSILLRQSPHQLPSPWFIQDSASISQLRAQRSSGELFGGSSSDKLGVSSYALHSALNGLIRAREAAQARRSKRPSLCCELDTVEGLCADTSASALDDAYPCWKCQAPVRSSWPRCPGCKAENKPPGAGE